MRCFIFSLQCFLFFVLLALFTTSDAREWKVNTTIDGEFESISEDGTKVSIRRPNGKVIRVPLTDFSKEDQAFIEQQNKTSNSANKQSSTSENEDQIDFTSTDLKAGDRVVKIINGVEFAFRWCPPGTFLMGSPTSEEGREPRPSLSKGYETQHQVTLTKGFWMMETEVTVGMFKTFIEETNYISTGLTPMGWTGEEYKRDIKYSWKNTGFEQTDSYPVMNVSWDDMEAFYRWLRKKIGMKCTLPTEAQWEYACRAGSTEAYAGDIDEMAWYSYNSGRKPHPVGTKRANAWGLYDMHGNVCERVLDRFGTFSPNAIIDPIRTDMPFLVYRGGGFNSPPGNVRSAFRNLYYEDNDRTCGLGFRLIIVSENSASTNNVAAVPNPIEQDNTTTQNETEQTVKKIDNVSNNQTNENRDYQVVPQEDAETQFKRGLLYYNGDGVPKDYVEAVKWFRKAGDRRHANALYYLGRCYDGGEGVPQSTAEAVNYWQQSASLGNADAQYMLGFCYIMGMGIQQDALKGFDWVKKAAAQGHQEAQNMLRNSGL